MSLAREQKLFQCFIAPLKPSDVRMEESRLLARLIAIWRRAHGVSKPRNASEESQVLGVSAETLRLWRNGETVLSRERLLRYLNERLSAVRTWADAAAEREKGKVGIPKRAPANAEAHDVQRLAAFVGMVSDQRGVYEAKDVLGFSSRTEMQETIDHFVYRRRPLLESCWLPFTEGSPERADSVDRAKEVIGHHLFYLRRDGRWWRVPARVRYVVKADHGQAFIRFKMSLPDSREHATQPFDLDGVVVVKDQAVMWIAESRPSSRQDHLYIITGHERRMPSMKCDAAWGKYLTIGQDNGIVSDVCFVLGQDRPAVNADPLVAPENLRFMRSAAILEKRGDEITFVKELAKALAVVLD